MKNLLMTTALVAISSTAVLANTVSIPASQVNLNAEIDRRVAGDVALGDRIDTLTMTVNTNNIVNGAVIANNNRVANEAKDAAATNAANIVNIERERRHTCLLYTSPSPRD